MGENVQHVATGICCAGFTALCIAGLSQYGHVAPTDVNAGIAFFGVCLIAIGGAAVNYITRRRHAVH